MRGRTLSRNLNLCKTCWVVRIEAYDVFMEVIPAVVGIMKTMSTESGWDSEPYQKESSITP